MLPLPPAFTALHESRPLPFDPVDYGAAVPDYVDAFFRNIHRETVSARLEPALKARALWAAGSVR